MGFDPLNDSVTRDASGAFRRNKMVRSGRTSGDSRRGAEDAPPPERYVFLRGASCAGTRNAKANADAIICFIAALNDTGVQMSRNFTSPRESRQPADGIFAEDLPQLLLG